MITLICGRAGSGKTTTLLKNAADSLLAGKPTFLLVPEQTVVDTEARMAALLGDRPTVGLEILSFRRLANRLFRTYGGLSYHYITKSGKTLFLWQTLGELAPMLTSLAPSGQNVRDRSLVRLLLRTISECKSYGITPAQLENSMKKLGGDDPASLPLFSKLSDLSLIFAAYSNKIAKELDDPSDDLTKAAALLKKHPFFAGADVYIDSFHGFTPQEYALLAGIFSSADQVTVALCTDRKRENRLFSETDRTAEKLRRLAEDCGGAFTEEFLTENKRAKSKALAHLEKYVWSHAQGEILAFPEKAPGIAFYECPNLFSECECVAADILKKVRAGASFRDFAVTARGLDRYEGILDVIFEKYGIPFFLSRRSDLTAKPLVRLILSAYAIRHSNFRLSDVMTYLKTGLADLSFEEISLLENYAETWAIRGSLWRADEWRMNPFGYTAVFSEEAAERLAAVNDLRDAVTPPLFDFFEHLKEAKTVREHCAALYDFLLSLSIPEKLEKQADELKEKDPIAANELSRLWSILIDALDELVLMIPDAEADDREFVRLLTLLFEETDIGTIPATVDEVVIGDASLLRATPKHIYLVGVNDGIFPAVPQGTELFTDRDRERLASLGVTLADGSEAKADEERFTFYRVLSSATDSVTLVYSSSDLEGNLLKPSIGYLHVKTLFPHNETLNAAARPITERLEGRNNLPELACEAEGTPLGDALKRYLAADPAFAAKQWLTEKRPLCESDLRLSEETAALLTKGDLALTQSRLNDYVKCHFSYFCKHLLKLGEEKTPQFDAADIGTLVHHILEYFLAKADGRTDFSNEEIENMVGEIVDDYVNDVCRLTPDRENNRLFHLFDRLKKSSTLLCRHLLSEFAQSKFKPAYLELPIGMSIDGKQSLAPYRFDLGDGSAAYLYGIADRVDTYRENGKLYVRIVDYKTGKQTFSMEKVEKGLDLQLLLYLFSAWKKGTEQGSVFENEEEILPAGILYSAAEEPSYTFAIGDTISEETQEKKLTDRYKRNGLLLNDQQVLDAMEPGLGGKYLPIRLTQKGTFSGADSLKTLEEFGELLTSVETTVKKIGREIKKGNASALPMRDGKHLTCDHCELKPICRHFERKGGNN